MKPEHFIFTLGAIIVLCLPLAVAADYVYEGQFGGPGTANGQFDSPRGVVLEASGRLVIADSGNNRIQVCTSAGSCSAFGSFGTGNGQFNLPWGVGVDLQDRIIVSDTNNNRMQIFAEAGSVSIDSFAAEPASIEAGQSVQLSWSVSGGVSMVLSHRQCKPREMEPFPSYSTIAMRRF